MRRTWTDFILPGMVVVLAWCVGYVAGRIIGAGLFQ